MEVFTCIISLASITISVITIFYTRKEINWQMEQARRGAMFQCVDTIAEYKHKLAVAKRLRSKTGEEISSAEEGLFGDLEELGRKLADISSTYKKRLEGVGGRLSEADHQNALAVNSQAREYIMMFEEMCSRFEGSRTARQEALTKVVRDFTELSKKILHGRDLAN